MLNPAVQPQDQLDAFTQAIKDGAGQTQVRLRNGDIVQPVLYAVPEDMIDFETSIFHVVSDCYHPGYRWNLDGSGIKNRDFDMIEIVG